MATVKEHYETVLSDVYSWMLGGFENGIAKNVTFFNHHDISPQGSGKAIDLGAGCGFQSIPLAQIGFSVLAIDLDAKLLTELQQHAENLTIQTIQDDLINVDQYSAGAVELVVCMTDTLVHLETREKVVTLFQKVLAILDDGGRLIMTFRDLSKALVDLDRFIPVKSDDSIIFTCFLEYEMDYVRVHDLVYRKDNEVWGFHKSFYHKLRLSQAWVESQLATIGFSSIDSTMDKGMVTVIATK